MDEKLWIINHRKENPKIKQNKIALDFSAKLKKIDNQIDKKYKKAITEVGVTKLTFNIYSFYLICPKNLKSSPA